MKITLNPDENFVNSIKEQLVKNGGYCPCRIEKTPDTKCMCKEFREQIKREESGECHCGLFRIAKI